MARGTTPSCPHTSPWPQHPAHPSNTKYVAGSSCFYDSHNPDEQIHLTYAVVNFYIDKTSKHKVLLLYHSPFMTNPLLGSAAERSDTRTPSKQAVQKEDRDLEEEIAGGKVGLL